MPNTSKTNSKFTPAEAEDIIAAIRAGRLANAIAFTVRAILDSGEHPERIRARQRHQAAFLLGGYLFEALQMIESLMNKHFARTYFSEFLALHARTIGSRDILAEINYNASFHHDWNDRTTCHGLETQEPPLCSLGAEAYVARDSESHYHSVYKFDTEVMVANLKGRKTRDEINEFVTESIPELAMKYLRGAALFVDGVTRKVSTSYVNRKVDRMMKAKGL